MGQKLVERIRALTLDTVVNFPGVPTEPSQVLGLPKLLLLRGSGVLGLLMAGVINALNRKEPPMRTGYSSSEEGAEQSL